MWAWWSAPGLEHLHLVQGPDGVRADGLLVGVEDGAPLRARYEIRCDAHWRFLELRLALLDPATRTLTLRRDEGTGWSSGADRLRALEGCVDVDVAVTPFTNSLVMRRVPLPVGQATELAIAYVTVPDLEVKPVLQRYTRLAASPGGGRVKYEGLSTGFAVEFDVDADGLVLDYPGVWRRVWPAPEQDR